MPRGRDENGRYVRIEDQASAVIKIKDIKLMFLFCFIVVVPWVYFFMNFWGNSSIGQFMQTAFEILNWFKTNKMNTANPV